MVLDGYSIVQNCRASASRTGEPLRVLPELMAAARAKLSVELFCLSNHETAGVLLRVSQGVRGLVWK
jgi:hypothetical protein